MRMTDGTWFGNTPPPAAWSGAEQEDLKKQRAIIAAQNAEIKRQQDLSAAQAAARPGVNVIGQNEFERRAGVTPPSYEGTRDVKTGELLGQYKFDPYGGEALKALKEQAFSQGESPWAKMQLQKQQMEQQNARGAAGRQAMQASAQAQSGLARMGGLGGGARALLAKQGARDALMAQQGVSREGMGQRLGIQAEDLNRKQGLLSQFGNTEVQGQQFNIGQSTGDIKNRAMFDANRYNQQMQAWGAQQSANAQRAAAGGGGKK